MITTLNTTDTTAIIDTLFIIGNFTNTICNSDKYGFVLTHQGKLYYNGTYIESSKRQQYLFFSNTGQLVINVNNSMIISKRKSNFIVVGLEILIFTNTKWKSYQYNEQLAYSTIIKTQTSNFTNPILLEGHNDNIITVNKSLSSNININYYTGQLNFINQHIQTGTIVFYFTPANKQYLAVKATITAILIVPDINLTHIPTFFSGVGTKNSWIPSSSLPSKSGENIICDSGIGVAFQKLYGGNSLFCFDIGQQTFNIQRSNIPLVIVDSGTSGSAGDITNPRTMVGVGIHKQQLAGGLLQASTVTTITPTPTTTNINNVNDIDEYGVDVTYTGTSQMTFGGFILNVTNNADIPIEFTVFQKVATIDINSTDTLAIASIPITNTNSTNNININGININGINTNTVDKVLPFDSIKINSIATGLPSVVGSVKVDDMFIALPTDSIYGPIVGYYNLIVPEGVKLQAETFPADDGIGKPQVAVVTADKKQVFAVYSDQQTCYPPCNILLSKNRFYGCNGVQYGQLDLVFT